MKGSSVPLLETRQLVVRAGARLLLDGLDWQVRPGQFWCVLGRNGVGKSSLLHVLAGLQPPHGGQVLLQGRTLSCYSPAQLALQRGLLLQHQQDAFSLPVLEAVMAGRFAHGDGWGGEKRDTAPASLALEQVGLAALATQDLLRLSGGERQRVALATLLVQAPALYLLDEPTSHQDIAAQWQVMQLLQALAQQGGAVVASCHDINLARRFASHVLLLDGSTAQGGRVEAVMQPAALEAAFGCRFVALASPDGMVFLAAQGSPLIPKI
ncbi:ABC transporter ATP-binding protein [uncultured Herbaspirillum sp.]|uniref:ABC transporter ATP-binding protein n=1 Tax=uncultured Herbaspirillum sp. TaxID=160236 RepID=UPI002633DE29|nr:ABC transporter ATP-binding protein [uncultured Herbaspirillum sp.]